MNADPCLQIRETLDHSQQFVARLVAERNDLRAERDDLLGSLEGIADAATTLLSLTIEGTRAWQLAGTIAQQARALAARSVQS